MIISILAWLFLSAVLPTAVASQSAAWLFIAGLLCSPLVLPALCMPPIFSCQSFFSDGFTSNDISNYDQRSGSWTIITGSVLIETSNNNALIVANATGDGHGRVKVDTIGSVLGSTSSAVGAYTDDNNYIFAELFINGTSSTFKLWKRVSGSNSLVFSYGSALNASAGGTYTIDLCWDGINAFATLISGGTLIAYGFGPCTVTGTKSGMAASANGSTQFFRHFSFAQNAKDNNTCPGCGTSCDAAACYQQSQNLQYTLTSVANGGCTTCSAWNSTWIVNQNFAGSGQCQYSITYTFSACGSPCGAATPFQQLTGLLSQSSGLVSGNFQILTVCGDGVHFPPDGQKTAVFAISDVGVGSAPADCSTINLTMSFATYGSYLQPLTAVLCDFSAASLTVVGA